MSRQASSLHHSELQPHPPDVTLRALCGSATACLAVNLDRSTPEWYQVLLYRCPQSQRCSNGEGGSPLLADMVAPLAGASSGRADDSSQEFCTSRLPLRADRRSDPSPVSDCRNDQLFTRAAAASQTCASTVVDCRSTLVPLSMPFLVIGPSLSLPVTIVDHPWRCLAQAMSSSCTC